MDETDFYYYAYLVFVSMCLFLLLTYLFILTCTSAAIIGTASIYSIPPTPSTRVGLLIAFCYTPFILAEGNLLFSLISRNVAGQTKKSTVLAVTFIAWDAGNSAAPQVGGGRDPAYLFGRG
jgi:hypothetical protein